MAHAHPETVLRSHSGLRCAWRCVCHCASVEVRLTQWVDGYQTRQDSGPFGKVLLSSCYAPAAMFLRLGLKEAAPI